MSISILLSLSLATAFMLPLMSQPLSLGLILMFCTLMMCVLVGLFFSSWYAYILFLIYVGGLLVMFAYVTALMPNMLFSSGKYTILFLILSLTLVYYFFSQMSSKSLKVVGFNDHTNFMVLSIYGPEFVSPLLISVFIGLSIMLLVNLIAVVKICFFYEGSLRTYK